MSDAIIRLKIVLDDTDPPIWRTIEVPAAITLKDLHRVIQAAMGWEDEHLFEFQLGRGRAANRTQLAELAVARIRRLGYLYDMGDSWQHTLRIEKTLDADPATAYPRLIGGAGRCPPEDCGGIPGFYNFLDAMADPSHPDHDDMVDWHGDSFDPADMGRTEIERRLARIAARRKPGSGKPRP